MTNTVQQEEQANPYNAKKDYHVEDKPFTPANQLYFEEPSEKNKLFDSDDITEVTSTDNVKTENLDTPYKKPDYKKRYDDLKKHYDSKLNEFKSREQELLEEAANSRPTYKAPKSPEDLEQFKNEYPDVYDVVETVAHMQSESKAKVLEEINELIEAIEEDTNKVHEAADVFYHFLMYLEANEIKIEDVMSELEKRKKK